jgi:tetratricopeptide (TPR) repeat protein
MGRAFESSRLFPPALVGLAHAEKWLGKYASASEHYVEAIAAARPAGSPSTISNGLYGLGQTEFWQGNYAAALSHMREALEVAQLAQHTIRVCEASLDLVYVYIAQQELNGAHDQLRETLKIVRDISTPHFVAKTLAAAVTLWFASGKSEQATVWAGLLTQYKQLLHPSLFDMTIYQRLEAALGPEHYHDALEQGKMLRLEHILSEMMSLIK